MKTGILVFIFCFFAVQIYHAQEEDGVVALSLPVRTSLTFNKYILNPTFSFVREQGRLVSVYNKREWVQFEDAPLTYLASFNGRLGENIGAGIGLFQQNYGVLNTFGGILNFAYNVQLERETNLTFGLNIGAYSSGLNNGSVNTNFDDPALQNIPQNFVSTVSPGINLGLAFFDFGVSVNNLVSYNLTSSSILEDNPERSIQGHIMYTGYMSTSGFLDNSKFTGLVRSEFKNDDTVISAIAMLTVPKGIWAQVGYNTTFGVSGGAGVNLTEQFALEYNFERAMGDLELFGPSHDITIAYRFKNNKRYSYGPDDEVVGLISTTKKPVKPKKLKLTEAEVEARKLAAEEKRANQLAERALKEEEQKAKEEAEAQAKLLAEQQAKEEAEAQAKLLAEEQAKEEAEAQAKLLAEQRAKEEAEAQARLLAEQKAKEEAEAQARLLTEQKAKEEAEAQARLLAEQQAKERAEAQAKLLAEQKAKEEAEAQAKLLAEQKAKEEAEAQATLLTEEQKEQAKVDSLLANPSDQLGKDMLAVSEKTNTSKTIQDDLLNQFNEIVEIKNQDLLDLKEENDLGEQGIAVAPKPFKSIAAEDA
ncbi:MAG: PorP/SprF family type IX secretion system membrane protein, partial [bacterium]